MKNSFYRTFHSSNALLALRNHRLFPKIDWERIEAGSFAVVDPVNPGVILYLSEQDYIVMIRVAITSNRTLKVLAVPGDSPEAPASSSDSEPSQNSPSAIHNNNVPFVTKPISGDRRRALQSLFSSPLRRFLQKERTVIKGKSQMVKTSMVLLSVRNARQWFHTWYNTVSWWTRGTQLSTVAMTERNTFGLWVVKILRNGSPAKVSSQSLTRRGMKAHLGGPTDLINRLKVMLFVVNSFLSGRPVHNAQPLGVRVSLSKGLPTAIPRIARSFIRLGYIRYIHLWTSMLFAYKGLLGTWVEPDLFNSTITQPHPDYAGNSDFENFQQNFCSIFWYNIIVPLGIKPLSLSVRNAFFTVHAGPNSPFSILGAGLDAFLWFCSDAETLATQQHEAALIIPELNLVPNEPELRLRHIREHIGVPYNIIREWLKITGQDDLLLSFRKTAKMFKMSYLLSYMVVPHYEPNARGARSKTAIMMTNVGSKILGLSLSILNTKRLVLQRLHNLYEAAGKVRTIAIVDYWTNFVLKPLHDWMFEILSLLPQDATFDQEGKVREFATRGYRTIYSLDLKSATDLIPLNLYRSLFSWVMPWKALDLWIDLLVNRDFHIPQTMLRVAPKGQPSTVRYTTGQPMGALTSWASMALVHHALVLWSAVNVGVTRSSALLAFRDYLILGDDVVIANRLVAEEYIRLCASLGIIIGLNKSFISDEGFFNFANQSFKGPVNISPLSMKEEAQITSLPARAELALRAVRRGWRSLTSRSWASSVLKLFVSSEQWNHYVQPFMAQRIMGPAIAWVLSVILVPGTTRLGFAGLGSIPLEAFFGAIARKSAFWGTKIEHLPRFVKSAAQTALIAVLAQWASTVYSEFLRNRKRLEVFDEWVSQIVSPDIEWLLKRVFAEARGEAFSKWTTKYRMPLKEIQVSTRMSNFNINDVEIGSAMAWTEIYKFVSEAEHALPQIPDFTEHTIEVLTALAGGADMSSTEQRRALNAFFRLTNLIGMIDHLGSFVTPGIVIPETSVSLTPELSAEHCLVKEEHSSSAANNQRDGGSGSPV